jgi:hypothetical protein
LSIQDVAGDRLVDLADDHDRRQHHTRLDGGGLQGHRIQDQPVDQAGPRPQHQLVLRSRTAPGLLDLDRPTLSASLVHEVVRGQESTSLAG